MGRRLECLHERLARKFPIRSVNKKLSAVATLAVLITHNCWKDYSCFGSLHVGIDVSCSARRAGTRVPDEEGRNHADITMERDTVAQSRAGEPSAVERNVVAERTVAHDDPPGVERSTANLPRAAAR